ncbi:MAG: gluconokinase [Comamonadaceae bacterium]|jgi:carbohydrate kinase (thermoresistant glucokinase family)|nr:gluconokinase [Comamonadaceae bacterium]
MRADMTELNASLRLVVMGVSGSGKSTLSAALGQRLGLEVLDGDDLHLPESVAKMRAGIALQDADRWPWLDRIGDHLAHGSAPGQVVACSALRRIYRDRIRAKAGDLHFIFLDGDFELISQRMARRSGHYMQPQMLESQFRTLERPTTEEVDVITLPITDPVSRLVETAVSALLALRTLPTDI